MTVEIQNLPEQTKITLPSGELAIVSVPKIAHGSWSGSASVYFPSTKRNRKLDPATLVSVGWEAPASPVLTSTTTLDLRADDVAILRSAVEAEIEHIGDYVRDLDDVEEIRNQRIRQDRLEAIWRTLAELAPKSR